jgi:hypothetical protein
MIDVVLTAPPSNASFSAAPLLSEAALLPTTAGYFRFVEVESATSGLGALGASVPVLLALGSEGELPITLLAGALRSLLSWGTDAPLHLRLVGAAASIVHALRAAIPSQRAPGIGGDTHRAARAHQYSASAIRLPDPYVSALHARMPGCRSASVVAAQVLSLLAPVLAPAGARQLLVLDPLALHMAPPTHLLRHAQRELRRSRGAPRAQCAIAAADGPGAPGTLPGLDAASLALDLACARSAGWVHGVQAALRSVLAWPARTEGCPTALLGELAMACMDRAAGGAVGAAEEGEADERGDEGGDEAEEARGGATGLPSGLADGPTAGPHVLGCQWGYQPASYEYYAGTSLTVHRYHGAGFGPVGKARGVYWPRA